MNIKRFVGKTSKDALKQVKQALGKDAVILSNRSVDGGHEIMAFHEEDMQALIQDEMQEDGIVSAPAPEPVLQAPPPAPKAKPSTVEAAGKEVDRPDFTLPDYIRPDMGKQSASSQGENTQQKWSGTNINEAFRSIDGQPKQAAPKATSAKTQRRAKQQPTLQDKLSEISTEDLIKAANATEAAVNASHNSNHNTSNDNNDSEMTAMLNEMRNMRESFETTVQQQAALKPLEKLPRPLEKAPLKTAKATPQPQQNVHMQAMLNEMRTMRSAFESQLTSMNWANIAQREPVKSKVLSLLLSAGFSPALSRQLAEKLPDTYQGHAMNEVSAVDWMKRILQMNLNTIESESALLDQGGIFALIGPTGVGKTTTTAKLAAKYVMKHGTENLGIITTDAYRVGGQEQLRIYGKILGVMVHAVKDETDLKIALNELRNKHTVLIDTVGVSQKDRMVADQIAMLSHTQHPINKLLCINATSTGATLSDVVKAYRGKGLDGAILTKIDEAATIGNALDVIIRNKLRLFYATNGQRVPEDIIRSDKETLIEQAFNINDALQNPYDFLEEELPFIMGQSTGKPSTEPSGV